MRRFCTCDQSSPNATLFISSHAQQPAKLNQKRRLERQFRLLEPKVDRGIPSRPPSRAYPNLPLVPVPLAPSRERTHGIGCVVARCAPRGLRRSPPRPPSRHDLLRPHDQPGAGKVGCGLLCPWRRVRFDRAGRRGISRTCESPCRGNGPIIECRITEPLFLGPALSRKAAPFGGENATPT